MSWSSSPVLFDSISSFHVLWLEAALNLILLIRKESQHELVHHNFPCKMMVERRVADSWKRENNPIFSIPIEFRTIISAEIIVFIVQQYGSITYPLWRVKRSTSSRSISMSNNLNWNEIFVRERNSFDLGCCTLNIAARLLILLQFTRWNIVLNFIFHLFFDGPCRWPIMAKSMEL